MRRWAALLIVCAGCNSSTPTAPSPLMADTLRWDLVAAGCTVATPVPALQDRPPTLRYDEAEQVRGLWLMSTSQPTQTRRSETYIEGVFHRLGNVWALCAWQTLQKDTIQ